MWLLIEVQDPHDVGKNEIYRYLLGENIRELSDPVPTTVYAELWGTKVHPATPGDAS